MIAISDLVKQLAGTELTKHGTHDQKTHGRRGSSGSDGGGMLGRAPNTDTEAAQFFGGGFTLADGRAVELQVYSKSPKHILDGDEWVKGTGWEMRILVDGQVAGDLKRIVSPSGKVVDHSSLMLEADFRRQGIGGQLFDRQIAQYAAAGVEQVFVETAMQGTVVWAKKGFDFMGGRPPAEMAYQLFEKNPELFRTPDGLFDAPVDVWRKIESYDGAGTSYSDDESFTHDAFTTLWEDGEIHTTRKITPQYLLERDETILSESMGWSGVLTVDTATGQAVTKKLVTIKFTFYRAGQLREDGAVFKHGTHDQKTHGRRSSRGGGDGGDGDGQSAADRHRAGFPGSAPTGDDRYQFGKFGPTNGRQLADNTVAEHLASAPTSKYWTLGDVEPGTLNLNDSNVRSEMKNHVVSTTTDALVDRVSRDPKLKEWVDEQLADRLAAYSAQGATPSQDVIDRFTWSILYNATNDQTSAWASSASDSNVKSLALQFEAAQIFGGHEGAERLLLSLNPDTLDHVAEYTDRNRPFVRAYAEETYRATQQWFSERGITHVMVDRGMRFTAGDNPWEDRFLSETSAKIDDLPGGDSEWVVEQLQADFDADLVANPLSSWSTSTKTAERFTQGDGRMVMLRMEVPVQRVFSTPHTGLGCLNEEELVVASVDRAADRAQVSIYSEDLVMAEVKAAAKNTGA